MSPKPIHLLDKATIDKIAAGEVVERPSSVVKELVENSIDAGSTAITVEIKDGGTELIRVTDNGCGISGEELGLAFLRHATSKISDEADLAAIYTLGFRGEALSSISAVAKVELITKPASEPIGKRCVIEGGSEPVISDIGAPEGSSIFVRRLFYNTPARRKFLKSTVTEGNYVTDLMERLALSHPEIAFKYIVNGKDKLMTPGNGKLFDVIYSVYGRQTANALIEIDKSDGDLGLKGYIGEPAFNRGNRGCESFFVNNRFIRSKVLFDGAEEGYKGYLMQHQYPFLVLKLTLPDEWVDVNVHPQKMDVRFYDNDRVKEFITETISYALGHREDISEPPLEKQPKDPMPVPVYTAEPFEKKRLSELKEHIAAEIRRDSPYSKQYERLENKTVPAAREADHIASGSESAGDEAFALEETDYDNNETYGEQIRFLSEEAKPGHKIIGQVFGTYWLVEYNDELYMIDQHAAHEKVLYERTMERIQASKVDKQLLSPPVIVSLSDIEMESYEANREIFDELGFTAEPFGGREYAITSIPANGLRVDPLSMFMAAVGACSDQKPGDSKDTVTERVAEMSCKAAIKGHDYISYNEAVALIDELLTLENPYHCPHGRPTIFKMSKYEIEKKFKRIV